MTAKPSEAEKAYIDYHQGCPHGGRGDNFIAGFERGYNRALEEVRDALNNTTFDTLDNETMMIVDFHINKVINQLKGAKPNEKA